MSAGDYITVKEALGLLSEHQNVSRQTLYRWAKEKKVRSRKRNNTMSFEKLSIEKCIQENLGETIGDPVIANGEINQELEEKKKEVITLPRDVLANWQNSAYERGKSEAGLLLAEKTGRLENEKVVLQKDNELLNKDREFLGINLRRERIQKWISVGTLGVWIIGWLIYFVFSRGILRF